MKAGLHTVRRIKNALRGQFLSYWSKCINTEHAKASAKGGNKLRTYRLFKLQFKPEKYLQLPDRTLRKALAQFRLGAHRLRIETDRFNSKQHYVPPELRTCKLCNLKCMEDETRFLIECLAYSQLREGLFEKIKLSNKYFCNYSDNEKLIWLMSNDNLGEIKLVASFIHAAMTQRGNGEPAT